MKEALDLLERDPYGYALGSDTLESLVQHLIDEIRRLRAENAELRASYERVEKYAEELNEQREKQADMIRTINPLYR